MRVIRTETQFQLMDEDKQIGKLDYEIKEDFIDAIFVGVQEEYRGTDAKDHLLNALIALSDELDKKIFCTCGFMRKWFSRNLPDMIVNGL